MRVFDCRNCCWPLLLVGVLGMSLLNGVAGGQTIVAHRGASFDAPENTLAAFSLAWEQGADAIEGDFYLTADKRIVCIHDKTTKRTAGVDLPVAQSTLEQLRALEYGSWKSEVYRGEPIPTLAEVLAIVPPNRQIFVEVKCGAEIVPYLKRAKEQSSLTSAQIVVISFDQNVIAETKRQIPEIAAHWLTGYEQDEQTGQWTPELSRVLTTLEAIGADGLDTQAEMKVVDRSFVKALRDEDYALHTWTVDDPDQAIALERLGVDSITTNRPRFLREALNERLASRAVQNDSVPTKSVSRLRSSCARRRGLFRRRGKRSG